MFSDTGHLNRIPKCVNAHNRMTTNNNDTNNGSISNILSQTSLAKFRLEDDGDRKNKNNRGNDGKVETNKCKGKKTAPSPKAAHNSKVTDDNEINTKTQGYQETISCFINILQDIMKCASQIQSPTSILPFEQVTEFETTKDSQQTTESPPKQQPTDSINSDIHEQQRESKNKETINKNKGNQLKATENERNISKLTSNQDKKIDGAKQKHSLAENSEIRTQDIYTQHTRKEISKQITQNKKNESSEINKHNKMSTSGASKKGKKINNNDIKMTQNGTSDSKNATVESAHNQNKTKTDPKSLPMHHKSDIDRNNQNKKVEHTGIEKNENMPISDSSKKRKTNSMNENKLADNGLKDSNKDKSDSTSNHENKTKDTNCSQISNTSNTEISTEKKEVEILEKDKHKEKPVFEASENNKTTESKEADTTKSCPTKTINFVEEVKREGLDLCKAAISDTLIYSIYSILDEIAKNGLKDFNFSDYLKRSFWELWNSLKTGSAEGLFTIFCNWVATKSVKLSQVEKLGGKLGISELKKICDDLYECRKTKWQIFIEVVKKILVKLAFYGLNYLITWSFGPLGYFSGFALSVGLGVVTKFVNKLLF